MHTDPLPHAAAYCDISGTSNGNSEGSVQHGFSAEIPLSTARPQSARVEAGISLVLPMFIHHNHFEVGEVVLQAAHNLGQRSVNHRTLVDGSSDDCAAQVQRWTAKDSRIALIRMIRNERFGGALRRGLAAARKDCIFYTDFDLPVDLECFPAIWADLQQVDMITGYSSEVPKNLSWNAKLLSIGYNGMVHAAFGLPLRDVNFGFKAMRKSVRDRLRLVSRSPFVDAEMFIQASRNGHTIREVPVPFVRRQVGVSRIRRLDVILWSMFDLARARIRPRGGQPQETPANARS